MQDWRKLVGSAVEKADLTFDLMMQRFRNRFNLYKPLHIVPYRSYGTSTRLYVKGRVLANKGISSAADNDTLWKNLVNMYRRFESDEVPNAQLRVKFEGQDHQVVTDKEGYFVLNLAPATPLVEEKSWHEIEIELLAANISSFEPGIKTEAHVLVPPPDAEYGIISDIDDTIVLTSATDLIKMSQNTFMNNARTRLPFAGVSAFYRSLQLGRNGKRNNPFFYVSSSPWNLYDLLHDFLDIHDIPAGPLLLRDFGLLQNKFFGADHMSHKFKEIQNILLTYPHLNFVLIGDSGQEDAPIYREVIKEFPGRIICAYIRDVELPERAKMVEEITQELKGTVEMILVKDTAAAAQHAADNGLIFQEEVKEVEAQKEVDSSDAPGTPTNLPPAPISKDTRKK
ncbi:MULTISPECIES: App1 family protein [Rufibacter]|uniref:Phosphatidate phosphatase APP1 n=1 Tax=Rufibacter quisquiliarum TaxID=1549639 RepID=A0A839GYF9_9BACT|nr:MULTISPECIES: phosphatase domain-containing protein [Rufibacter]MBA9078711.1 phosphatidate phosphatase APP1 [Rufibacter quisquiliarum]